MHTYTSSVRDTSHVSVIRMSNAEKPIEVGNEGIEPPTKQNVDAKTPKARYFATTVRRMSKASTLETVDERQNINSRTTFRSLAKAPSALSFKTNRVSVLKSPRNKMLKTHQIQSINGNLHEQAKTSQHKARSFFNTQSARGKNTNITDRRLEVIELDSTMIQRPRHYSVSGNARVVRVKRLSISAKSM